MKTKFLRLILILFAVIGSWQHSNAQCSIGTGSNTYDGTWFPGCNSYTTNNSIGPGQYVSMPMRNGGSYTINTCGNGTYSGYDTQITVRRTNNSVLGYDDNSNSVTECPGKPLNSYLDITGTVNEYVRVGVKRYNCQVNSGGSTSVQMRFRQNNNLAFPGGSACEGTTVNLSATPARTSNTSTSFHARGYYTGTGTNGDVANLTTYNDWTAPSVSINTSYLLTYTFGACTVNATWTSLAKPNGIANLTGSSTPCIGNTTIYTSSSSGNATSYEWSLPSGWTGASTTSTIAVTAGTGSGTIQVRGVNACGVGPWKTISVSAITVVGPPVFISGTNQPCNGTTYTYSVGPVSGATSYLWTLPSGWTGSSTGLTLNATASGIGGNVTCQAVNSCGAGPAVNFPVAPLSTPAQPSVISGDSSPCIGLATTYSVTNVSGLTYNWSFPSGWTVNSGAGTNSINVTTSSTGGTVSVTASNACFTGAARTLSVSMDDVIGPAGAVAGNTTPCQGVATTYSISPVSGATSYQWTLPSGWSGSSTGLSISATNDGSVGTVSVAVVNECGVGPNSDLSVDPILDPVQPGTISGNTLPCVGGSETYSVAAVPEATSYNWTLPSGWSGTSSTNSISVTVGSSGGTISVTASNSCSTSPARTLNVGTQDVLAAPGAIAGNTSPCEGTAYTYSISPVAGASSYQWSAPSGWVGSSTGVSISYTPTSGAASGNVSVQAVNVCGAGASSDLAVVPLSTPSTPSAISGSTVPCNGQTYTYSVTNVPGLTYNWTLPAGWTGSSTTNSISVTVGANPGTISVTATNICPFTSTPSSLFVTPDDVPIQPNGISGDDTPCIGNTLTYSVTAVPGAVSYDWVLPSGWTGTSTTNSIDVTIGAGTGTIQVRGVNGCGNGLYRDLAVTAIDVVGPPATLSGTAVPCNGTAYTYSVSPVSGATSYQWTLPAGWTGTSTGLAITATASGTSGNITCSAVNSCGAGAAISFAVAPLSIPSAPSSISGDATPCIAGTLNYSVTNDPTLSYNWTLPSGWIINSGAGSNSINVTTSSTGGTISVTATNACFTGPASTLPVVMDDVLGAPGAISGNLSPCQGVAAVYSISPVSGASSYQWSLPAGWTGSSTGLSISITNNGLPGTVSVAAVNDCGAGATSDLSVDPILDPVQPDPIAGETVPCVGFVETYSVAAVPEATSYNWTLPSGWTGSSTTNSINATVGSTGGTISVTATNSCSTGPARTLAVTTQDVVGPPGSITGEVLPCIGSVYTYSISPVSGAASYQWTLPSGWSGSSTSTSISAFIGATAGNVSVQAVTVCGAGPSVDLPTTPITTPVVPASLSGPNPACIGVVNTYTCTAVPSATSYNWTFPAGWSGPATTATNTVNVTPSATAGSIIVNAENACGISSDLTLVLPVSDIPVADFTAAPFGVTATFSDSSTFNPTSWLWDFGDSNTSTDQNPFHYYGTGGTYTVCLTATNSCGTSAISCQSVIVPDYFDYVWLGTIDTDWETGGNWSGGLVPFGDNVLIPNQVNDPVISAGQIALVNSITMNSGADLTIASTGELHVTGDWDWPGTHSVGGLVVWDGFVPQPQVVNCDITFENMRVENSLTLNGYSPSSAYVALTGGLTIDGGDLVTLDHFTVISNGSGTGWIDPLVNGGSITGDVSMQRYISNAGFHYIGSPINTPLLASQLSEFAPYGTDGAQLIPSVTCSSDTLAQGSPYGNIMEFNESNNFFSSTCPYWGWNVRSTGSLTNGRGYSVRNAGAMTMDMTGTINDGSISNAGLTNSGGTYSGFHIVSNPYPSPMLWTPPAGFDGFMYAWQTSGQYSGTYQSYPPGTQVASMQGFFVKVSSGTAAFVTDNSMRVTGDPAFWRAASPLNNTMDIVVSKDGVADKTTLQFNSIASEDWDSKFDGMKLPGNTNRPTLYTRTSDILYSVNSLPPVVSEKTIPLGFSCGIDGDGVFDFEFKFRTNTIPNVYLLDRKTGVKTSITDGGRISVTVSEDDDIERFALLFNPTESDIISSDGVYIYNSDETVVVNSYIEFENSVVEVFDVMGNLVYAAEPNGNQHRISSKEWRAGVYIVRVNGSQNASKKLVIH